ncbi:MAG: 4-hydroxy-4-methyl-2-oxoglutarate aldolase [Paraglaciecola sp.]|jgi:4-hydroxy-4-methyl-2-oxoglutarate aldolase
MLSMSDFAAISPCEYADGLGREQFVDFAIKALWSEIPRIAGPAFTVKCAPGDHLSLHAAIYEASAGDIIVVEADPHYAVAGGNVCAIAQQRGIAGFVVDGVIRDLAQVRKLKFPVFARGVIPKPGAKTHIFPFNQTITCGGAKVNSGDIIVADEEGIAVIPQAKMEEVYAIAQARTDKDAAIDLDQWRTEHQQKVASLVLKLR